MLKRVIFRLSLTLNFIFIGALTLFATFFVGMVCGGIVEENQRKDQETTKKDLGTDTLTMVQ